MIPPLRLFELLIGVELVGDQERYVEEDLLIIEAICAPLKSIVLSYVGLDCVGLGPHSWVTIDIPEVQFHGFLASLC